MTGIILITALVLIAFILTGIVLLSAFEDDDPDNIGW